MSYKIFHTKRFDKELSKTDKTFQDWVDKIEEKLSENPYTGKPIDVEWFREKKLKNYRVYFIIYEDLKSVYVVALSTKKDQQKIINTIKLLLDVFKEEIQNLVKST